MVSFGVLPTNEPMPSIDPRIATTVIAAAVKVTPRAPARNPPHSSTGRNMKSME